MSSERFYDWAGIINSWHNLFIQMCIQTEEQKPSTKTSKTCDTQTETQVGQTHCVDVYNVFP